MRVLFCVYPFPGHLFSLVPTAWALRAAGHDVVLGTVAVGSDTLGSTGLPTVQVADPATVQAIFDKYSALYRQPGASPEGGQADANPVTGLLAEWSRAMADGTLDFAERWRPDLVVHDLVLEAGPLAAAMLGTAQATFRSGFHPAMQYVPTVLRQCLADVYERRGVDAAAPRPAVTVDVVPPSLNTIEDGAWRVRYVPYGGGGMLPDWLTRPAPRARIAVTLGTTTPEMLGLGPLRAVVDSAAAVDAEFVLALGGTDPAPLGPLPENVRVCGWVPMHALLETCSAVVHQGGVGTTLTSLNAGVPQLILPTDFDHFANAEAVAKRGCGRFCGPQDPGVDTPLLRELLEDPAMRAAAAEVRAEMAAQPSPADLVGRFAELAAG